MAEDKLMGTGTFLKRTGINPPRMRYLEAAGIIKPLRTDTGWRSFREQDVAATMKWLAAKRRA
jgi:DNA-binding transcriptional MerR regulator